MTLFASVTARSLGARRVAKGPMRVRDYIAQAFSNLWKKKLRTFLTTFGVAIGIGALFSMFSFGKGVQKNVTDTFRELELFNYINVFPRSKQGRHDQSAEQQQEGQQNNQSRVLDDDFIREAAKLEGVELAFPEIRFPALIQLNGKDKFSLVQALPADICRSGLVKLRAGSVYTSDEQKSLIISDSALRSMKIKDPQTVIGQEIELCTLTLGLDLFNLSSIVSVLRGDRLPFVRQSYSFTVVGVVEKMGFGGSMPLRSDVFVPLATAQTMKKLSLTSIWDFFEASQQVKGYSMVSVRLSSPKYIEPVKKQLEDWGFRTFALIDEMQEMKRGFIFMDMFLFAVGMIAITVASLGIINTMVMSILERYREIGIMKAVGASDRDVKKIFFFESAAIGFLGGVSGLALGWAVSMVINQVANHFLARQAVPYMNYFSFPWWLCLGAVTFAVLVSLVAGIYPTMRAARVDPVVALRHD
jgi:putative ABC transport system permease protein